MISALKNIHLLASVRLWILYEPTHAHFGVLIYLSDIWLFIFSRSWNENIWKCYVLCVCRCCVCVRFLHLVQYSVTRLTIFSTVSKTLSALLEMSGSDVNMCFIVMIIYQQPFSSDVMSTHSYCITGVGKHFCHGATWSIRTICDELHSTKTWVQ